jgi:prepilin-type processing-associated H-X9-DG protein
MQNLSIPRKSARGLRALTLTELLVVVATIAVLSAILFPVFKQASLTASSNKGNVRKIALAAIHYGDDYDERIPIVINGAWRNLKNTKDGVVTIYGDQRSDLWPLLLLPYVKDRSTYVDPSRPDVHNIFSGPPLASSDPGYDALGATYRNQNQHPFFGLNYLFLSPLEIPSSKMSDTMPTDFAVGEVHRFFQADDPAETVFFAPSTRGRVPQSATDNAGVPDLTRGYFGINAPGLWDILVASNSPYLVMWTGANCSGDWCGEDIDPTTRGTQTSQNAFYEDPSSAGNNVAFLDGHVKFSKTVDLAAGTNYLTASPSDGGSGAFGGGATITDKKKYIWNLDDNYYGA